MYPPLFINSINENATEQRKIIFKNCDGKLCKELCGIFSCLSCVCILYLIFFTHVINTELNMNMTLF